MEFGTPSRSLSFSLSVSVFLSLSLYVCVPLPSSGYVGTNIHTGDETGTEPAPGDQPPPCHSVSTPDRRPKTLGGDRVTLWGRPALRGGRNTRRTGPWSGKKEGPYQGPWNALYSRPRANEPSPTMSERLPTADVSIRRKEERTAKRIVGVDCHGHTAGVTKPTRTRRVVYVQRVVGLPVTTRSGTGTGPRPEPHSYRTADGSFGPSVVNTDTTSVEDSGGVFLSFGGDFSDSTTVSRSCCRTGSGNPPRRPGPLGVWTASPDVRPVGDGPQQNRGKRKYITPTKGGHLRWTFVRGTSVVSRPRRRQEFRTKDKRPTNVSWYLKALTSTRTVTQGETMNVFLIETSGLSGPSVCLRREGRSCLGWTGTRPRVLEGSVSKLLLALPKMNQGSSKEGQSGKED